MNAISLLSVAGTVFLICVSALAQASFRVSNSGFGVHAPVYDWEASLLAGSHWRAEVYGGASSCSLSPLVNFYDGTRAIVPFYQPGYFRDTGVGADVYSVLDIPRGGSAWLQVKVWDVRLGGTYEEASARQLGGYGESNIFYAQGGNPALVVPTPSGPLLGLQSFSVLREIPEQATWALLVLGGLAVWWAVRDFRVGTAGRPERAP